MKPAVAAGAVVVAALIATCGVGVLALTAVPATAACTAPADGDAAQAEADQWSGEQVTNATTIVAVGARMEVPSYGWVVAVATAMQESGLRNLGHLGDRNDHDSLGLFQQRPSQGWGTPGQVTDPVYAATAFYAALLRVPGWEQLPLTVAAQAVQHSAFGDAYAKHEPAARALVAAIATRLGSPMDCDGWVLPLPPGSYTLSSPYGPRWGTHHDGQDFVAPAGTPILAASAGTVTAAGCTSPFCDRPGDVDESGRPITRGCGLRVIISHPGRIVTVYCHAVALSVKQGQTVTAGQVIGWVGSTGNSTGPHLHFEVHVDAPPVGSANAVDPVVFLASVGVQV